MNLRRQVVFLSTWRVLHAAAAVLALAVHAGEARAQLTLRLRVPAATRADSAVYVAGSFNAWNPADSSYRLTRSAGGEYELTLPGDVRGGIEFKFTRGGWERVETDSAGGGISNRRFTVPATGAATWTGAVAAWQDPARIPPKRSTRRPSVTVLDTAFPIPQLGRARRVWVYLPPDYATSGKRYPVLYMHDGQNVFDEATAGFGEWGVDETLDSLAAAGHAVPIVVAVDHGGGKRLDEYSPFRNARHGGGEGDAYVDFLVRTLKPYIDGHFRTRPDRLHTGIAGSSMGGLISLYAALKHPRVYGRAGVFSPAFWFSDQNYRFARAARPLPGTRIFMVTGAREGDTPEVYANDHRRMADTLAAAGFRPGVNVRAYLRGDGQHSEWFWRREFPAAVLWLFDDDSVPARRSRR